MCLTKKEIDLLESAIDVAESCGFNVSDDREIIAKLRARPTQRPADVAAVCPECGSDVIVCMMGHYCGEKRPAANA